MAQTSKAQTQIHRPKLTLTIPYTPLLATTSSTPLSTSPVPTAPTSPNPKTPIFPSLPPQKPCLQCHLLNLKCSFTTPAHVLPPRVPLHPSLEGPDVGACVRCKRDRESFCIQVRQEQEGGETEYWATGVEGSVLKESVEEMLEEQERRRRWMLPVASKGHREAVLKKVLAENDC